MGGPPADGLVVESLVRTMNRHSLSVHMSGSGWGGAAGDLVGPPNDRHTPQTRSLATH